VGKAGFFACFKRFSLDSLKPSFKSGRKGKRIFISLQAFLNFFFKKRGREPHVNKIKFRYLLPGVKKSNKIALPDGSRIVFTGYRSREIFFIA